MGLAGTESVEVKGERRSFSAGHFAPRSRCIFSTGKAAVGGFFLGSLLRRPDSGLGCLRALFPLFRGWPSWV